MYNTSHYVFFEPEEYGLRKPDQDYGSDDSPTTNRDTNLSIIDLLNEQATCSTTSTRRDDRSYVNSKNEIAWQSYLQDLALSSSPSSTLFTGNQKLDENFMEYLYHVSDGQGDELADSNTRSQSFGHATTTDLKPTISPLPNVVSQGEASQNDVILATNPSDSDPSTPVLPPFMSSQSSTVFHAQERYKFSLEAPTSIVHRCTGDTLTYINKGQFYALNFEGTPETDSSVERVKSVLHLVFRDEKEPRNELLHWQYWHSKQPNPSQRAFDIDRKACQNIEEHIEEVAYNATAFYWNPSVNAKITVRMNCLSTDFSSQKGVKGIPLHLQIDTYEDLSSTEAEPVHRAFCKVKIFRDKGAERKNKDESKSAQKRIEKLMKSQSQDVKAISAILDNAPTSTYLTPTTPLGPKPALFLPHINMDTASRLSINPTGSPASIANNSPASFFRVVRERENKRSFTYALAAAKDELADLEVATPMMKSPRVARPQPPAVTIYVKKEEEKVYRALLLKKCTVNELLDCVAKKYSIPAEMITDVYKCIRKDILVKIDDELVEHFKDEEIFDIQLNFDNKTGHFDLVLKATVVN